MNYWVYADSICHLSQVRSVTDLIFNISQWLLSFCLRNNTKPKQESFEFKPPQGPPPQPPTQVSAQVRKDIPVIHSPVTLSIHLSIYPLYPCLHQTQQQFTLHHLNFTLTFVFSYIHPAVPAPTDPFILCPFILYINKSTYLPTFPRTNKVHFYLYICLFTATCQCYRTPCIKERLSAFKVTPQSTVFTAELIWQCGDGFHR